MLHCLNTSGNLAGNCSDMTVLERQRHRMRWQQQQQQQHQQQPELQNQSHGSYGGAFGNEFNGVGFGMESIGGSALGEVVAKSSSAAVKPDPVFENAWLDLAAIRMPGASGFGSSRRFDANSAVSTNSTTAVTEAVSAKDSSSGKESFKKRKSDNVHKVVAENENKKEKKMKGSVEEGDSKLVTEQNSNKNTTTNTNNNNNNSNKTCGGTSKDNSKASEAQKSDYIHVRARRGQATDSHSLAERVRREKISERMKYLQDLVPGCNKITGKAGMLDEIINYVQSLQRQVEFLSMKLAAVNPRLDFNLDDLFSKEVFGACGPSFATMGIGSDMNNQASYVQLNSTQQQVLSSCCGLDIHTDMAMNHNSQSHTDMALLRRSFSAPLSNPQTFLESSCFTQILPSTWESDFHNLSNVPFDQARQPTSFTSQPFTGPEGSNPKMEM